MVDTDGDPRCFDVKGRRMCQLFALIRLRKRLWVLTLARFRRITPMSMAKFSFHLSTSYLEKAKEKRILPYLTKRGNAYQMHCPPKLLLL